MKGNQTKCEQLLLKSSDSLLADIAKPRHRLIGEGVEKRNPANQSATTQVSESVPEHKETLPRSHAIGGGDGDLVAELQVDEIRDPCIRHLCARERAA
jgi:hypothetical protein